MSCPRLPVPFNEPITSESPTGDRADGYQPVVISERGRSEIGSRTKTRLSPPSATYNAPLCGDVAKALGAAPNFDCSGRGIVFVNAPRATLIIEIESEPALATYSVLASLDNASASGCRPTVISVRSTPA